MPTEAISQRPERVSNILRISTLSNRANGIGGGAGRSAYDDAVAGALAAADGVVRVVDIRRPLAGCRR